MFCIASYYMVQYTDTSIDSCLQVGFIVKLISVLEKAEFDADLSLNMLSIQWTY